MARINVYCDESCHLLRDRQKVMVLGAVWCPFNKKNEISTRLREIKSKHGLKQSFELKWVKVSPAMELYYLDVIDYFFDDDDLHFRALIVPDKEYLLKEGNEITYNDWYYDLHFNMLKVIFDPCDQYFLYLDIKDTHGVNKAGKINEILENEYSRSIIQRVQNVRSHEIEILQLTDLLIGAVAYANRGLSSSLPKIAIVKRVEERAKYPMTKSTLYQEEKFNLVRWEATGKV